MTDKINVAGLVKRLRRSHLYDGGGEGSELPDDAADALEAQARQIASRAWCPISETPPEGVTLIVCDNRVGGGYFAAVRWDGELLWSEEPISFLPAFFTHWQLADEPPECAK